MTRQIKTNERDEHPAVRSAVPATTLDDGGADAVPPTALDGQTGTGAIAIFYGAARKSSSERGPVPFLTAALTGRPSIRRSVKTDRNERFSAQRKRSILGECRPL